MLRMYKMLISYFCMVREYVLLIIFMDEIDSIGLVCVEFGNGNGDSEV